MDYTLLFVFAPFLLIGVIISYFFLKPYLKNKDTRQQILKWGPIFVLCCFILSLLGSYLQKGPSYFEAGIKQLKTNKYIENKVGNFNSYSYHKLPKEANPVKFSVQLSGNGIDLFLTCTMKYLNKEWLLINIKSDSLKLQRE